MSDGELAALASAADPDPELGDDAVSFWDLVDSGADPPLPAWYMPAPVGGSRMLRGWRRHVVLAVVASLLLITAAGLCNTYGQLGFG